MVNRGPAICFLAGAFTFGSGEAQSSENAELSKSAQNKLETSNPDKIPEFYFDELAAFGSKEVQEFGVGGVVYEK